MSSFSEMLLAMGALIVMSAVVISDIYFPSKREIETDLILQSIHESTGEQRRMKRRELILLTRKDTNCAVCARCHSPTAAM